MNVLRVIATMDPKHGGPSQGIRNSIVEMGVQGVVNEVVCFDDHDSLFLNDVGFQVHPLGRSEGVWQSNKKLIPWLLTNLVRFDVIIIHGLWLYNSYATFRAYTKYCANLPKEKRPLIFIMPHGMLDPYFQREPRRKIKALRNWLYWKIVESKVVNGVNGVLFTCEQELILARHNFRPYSPKKELNIGYGIQEPPAFRREMLEDFFKRAPTVEGNPYFLFLSRVQEKKGVDKLIDAYLMLTSTDSPLPQLVIAGPGLDSPYARALMKKVENNKNILFVGMLQGDAKWGAFYGCEAFILPSHQENFGISVVEAMACSKPVLISNQVNIWKEISAGNAGLVEADTKEGALKLLSTWYSMTHEKKKQKGENARSTYLKNFTIRAAVSRMIEAIDQKKSANA